MIWDLVEDFAEICWPSSFFLWPILWIHQIVHQIPPEKYVIVVKMENFYFSFEVVLLVSLILRERRISWHL